MTGVPPALRWAGLFAVAAAYYAIGIRLPLEWVDAGHVVYPSWLVAHGAVPYREFREIYGPSLFFWNGLLFRVFGDDLMVMRWSMVVIKAAISVLVYVASARLASRTFAWFAFAATLALWGLPFPAFTTPYASYHALLATLPGLLVVLAMPDRARLACLIAGLCFGVAATFKQTSGAFAFVAVALFLLGERREQVTAPSPLVSMLARSGRIAVLVGALALFGFYLSRENTALNLAILLPPVLLVVGRLAFEEWTGVPPASQAHALWALASLSLGMAVPLAAYSVYYAAQGIFDELVFNLFTGVPRAHEWLVAYPPASGLWPLWLGVWAGVASALAAGSAGRGRTAMRIAGLAVAGACGAALLARGWSTGLGEKWWWWSTNDLTHWTPAVVAWVSAGAFAASRRVRSNRGIALWTCFAVTSALFLYPSADLIHAILIAPVLLPLIAAHLERVAGAGAGSGRARVWGCVYAWGLAAALVVPAVHDLAGEASRRASESGRFARATGIAGAEPISDGGSELIAWLEEQPGDELFVLSGKPLIYFLSGRTSPVDRSEFGVYLIGIDFISDEGVDWLVDEQELVRSLARGRPLVVDDTYNRAGLRFRRRLPEAARFIEENYAPVETFGRFRVLRARS